MQIGGIFCLEDVSGKHRNSDDPGILDRIGGEDQKLCMSGRCAIYYCLQDLVDRDMKRVAYLPAYTCETVIAPYKKAGYTLRFYDVSPERLVPRFDRKRIPEISVLGLCGYYGFSYYDRDFVAKCADAGVFIIQDTTHSIFSADGIEERADYTVGSLRKWMGIPCGGIAVKRRGAFTVPQLPAEEEHVRGRIACMEEQERAARGAGSEQKADDIFWAAELRLRKMFDAYGSDRLSADIITNFTAGDFFENRRKNYGFILAQNPFGPKALPVFPELEAGVCPCHMSIYSPDRELVQRVLGERNIRYKFFWPFHGELDLGDFPGANYIYGHIYSVPVDQRYTPAEMTRVCEALEAIAR
jgi:hypothetical protein